LLQLELCTCRDSVCVCTGFDNFHIKGKLESRFGEQMLRLVVVGSVHIPVDSQVMYSASLYSICVV